MHIQLIAKADASLTGTSRYAQELRRSLQQMGHQVSLTSPDPLPGPGPLMRGLKRAGLDLQAFFASYPLRVCLEQADVYHITAQTMATLLWLQQFPAPVLVTVLDIIPYLVRGDRQLDTSGHALNRLFYRLALHGLRRASALVAISQYTKRTLVEHLGLPSGRIHVVYPAVDPQKFRPWDVPDAFRARYGLGTDQQYVLYVGSDDPRKNLSTLVQGFALLRQTMPRAKLLKVGAPHFPQERQRLLALVDDLGIQEDVLFFDHLPDDELPLFYNVADVLAMPSLYEGFGLPVAEAMACGTPVVCSDATSLPEVASGSALLVSPHSPHDLASALVQVLMDGSLAGEMRRKGRNRLARFASESVTEGLMQAYALTLV